MVERELSTMSTHPLDKESIQWSTVNTIQLLKGLQVRVNGLHLKSLQLLILFY